MVKIKMKYVQLKKEKKRIIKNEWFMTVLALRWQWGVGYDGVDSTYVAGGGTGVEMAMRAFAGPASRWSHYAHTGHAGIEAVLFTGVSNGAEAVMGILATLKSKVEEGNCIEGNVDTSPHLSLQGGDTWGHYFCIA
ncbi:hypothetical protein BDQ12DRAFT_663362 [Crucibulum laeve]|uniref:Uncharacterized protein n=1 Tax=Crucibulum laeve TaxID=68775 RepID=A0A5C3ME32_9AGAR|nr:hypothetical protein BDQ12DRAFT_663362 [Crucibulum laeve]